MKKLFTLFLTLILCLSLFASCKKDNNQNSGNTGDDSAQTSSDGTIWKNGMILTIVIDNALADIDTEVFDYTAFYNDVYAVTRKSPRLYYSSAAPAKSGNEIVIGETDRDISKISYERLDTFLYSANEGEYTGWLIYAKDGSICIAYDREIAFREAMSYLKNTLFKNESLKAENGIIASNKYNYRDKVNAIRDEERSEAFAAAEQELSQLISKKSEELNLELNKNLSKDTINALRKLYSLYTDEIYLWMTDLYEPNICVCETDTCTSSDPVCGGGGFYFSNSGRNNLGFLPDIESTAQILSFTQSSGLFSAFGDSYVNALSEETKAQLLKFAKGLQSPEDGFFYHPQWGKEIIAARRGRDLGWATSIIETLGSQPYYDAPDGSEGELGAPGQAAAASYLTGRICTSLASAVAKVTSSVKATSTLPYYLQSLSAWAEYIEELNIPVYSYEAGNTLAAQHNEVWAADKALKAANPNVKYEDTYSGYLITYLNAKQNQTNGLWEPQVDYNSVNGLMKLISSYNYYGATMPNADKAMDSAIEIALKEDGDTHVCSVYNPWVSIALIIQSVERQEKRNADYDPTNDQKIEISSSQLRMQVLSQAPALIDVTREKLSKYMVDGAFHYHSTILQHTSQAASVACADEFEADVNASCICSTGITCDMFDAFGISYVDIYTAEDGRQFLENLNSLDPVIKDNPAPVKPEKFDRFDSADGAMEYGTVTYPANNSEVIVPDKTLDTYGLNYKYYRADVLADPKPKTANDKALNMQNLVYDTQSGSKDYAGGMLLSQFNVTNGYVVGSTYIVDTDIMVESSDNNTTAQLFLSGTSHAFSLNITAYEKDGVQYLRLWDNYEGADGVKNNNLVDGIALGEWFNLRIEFYKIYTSVEGQTSRDLDIVAKIFVNGKFVNISDSAPTLSSNPSKFVDRTVTSFKVAQYRSCASSVWIDNVKIEKSAKNYEFEKVEVSPEDTPDSIPEISGAAVGGAYYKSESSLGKKYSFDTLVKAPALTNGQSAKTYIVEALGDKGNLNGAVYFWKTESGDPAKDEATTHTFPSPTEVPENMIIVGELDMAVGGLPENSNKLFRIILNGNGYAGSVYISTDEKGNLIFENEFGTSTYNIATKQNTWYNIRLEAYVVTELAMNIKVYIDGTYAFDIGAENLKASSLHALQIQWQAAAPLGAFVLYDNLFAGYDAKEYVYPENTSSSSLPKFDLPEGTHGGGVLYNDTTNGGKRVDFSERSQVQIMLNASGKESTATTLLVDGAVLYKRNDTLTNDNVYYQVPTSNDMLSVAEFDIAFSNLEGANAAYISFYTGINQSQLYKINVGIKNGKIHFGDFASYVDKADDFTGLDENLWYNLRFELYTILDGSGVAKVYVNNEYAFTVKAQLDMRTNQARVMFQLYSAYDSASIMVDNIFMGEHKKSYTIGETGEPEKPPVYPETDVTLGGTHEGGGVYNSDAYGSRLDFEDVTNLPVASDTSDIIVHRNEAGFLVLEQIGKSSGYITINYPKIRPTANEYHRVVNVVEFDALLSGVDELEANTLIAKIILYSSEGHRTSAYFTYNKEAGKIQLPTPNKGITEGSLVEIDPTVWNNFRFEYRIISGTIVCDLYVNESLAATFMGEDNTSANADMVRISFHNGAPNGGVWYALDNIYTGFKTEEIPQTPRVDGPEGISGTHDGGGVYNSDTIGTRFNFEGLTVEYPSSSDNTLSESALTNDGYLYYKQLASSGQSYIEFTPPAIPNAEEGKTIINVLEFDAFVGGVEDLEDSALIGRVIVYTGGKTTSYYFNYNKDTGLIELPKWGTITTGEVGQLVTFNPGEWNNFRFEYYIKGSDIVADFYLNGSFAASFIGEENSSKSGNSVRFNFHNAGGGSFYGIDNIYMGNRVENIDESEETTLGKGVYYTDTEGKAGNRWDMNSTALKNNYSEWWMTADTLGAKVSAFANNGDQILYARRTDSDTAQFTLGYRNTSVTAQTQHPENHITVVEYDIKFTDMPVGTSKIWQFNLFTGGAVGRRATIYFGTDADGKVVLNGMGAVYTDLKLEQDVWYNIRITLDLSGNCKIYINNILQTYIKDDVTLDSFIPDNGFTEKNGYSRMEANFTNTATDVNCGIYLDNFFLGADITTTEQADSQN